jgi:hypothetical protein
LKSGHFCGKIADMSWTHQATTEAGSQTTVVISDVPDECPQCHNKGTFSALVCYQNSQATEPEKQLEIIYRCPNSKCHEVFIGYYKHINGNVYSLDHTEPSKYVEREFTETIKGISSEFPTIYNQALKAEDDGLDQICGPGYRKALEFLIKDYLLSKATEAADKETIKAEQLGMSISVRIQDANIKGVAKRAVWLGNDETHYIRKWEQKDLQDLKNLIDLTVHWMEAEALTTQLLKDMPDGNAANEHAPAKQEQANNGNQS